MLDRLKCSPPLLASDPGRLLEVMRVLSFAERTTKLPRFFLKRSAAEGGLRAPP